MGLAKGELMGSIKGAPLGAEGAPIGGLKRHPWVLRGHPWVLKEEPIGGLKGYP